MDIALKIMGFYYMVGCFVIGLPMAIASLIFYCWGEDFDKHRWFPVLKIIRNTLHPIIFIIGPIEERKKILNNRGNYGPIGLILDHFEPKINEILFYLIVATILWPVRISIPIVLIVFVASLGGCVLAIMGILYLLNCLVKILWFVCKIVAWPLLATSKKSKIG